MTRINLVRKWQSATETAGVLTIGVRSFFSLEDALRPPGIKIPGLTCIPSGEYGVRVTPSGRAQQGGLWSPRDDFALPLLLDVPGFEGIRIHAGNRDQDTQACILVGYDLVVDGRIQAPKGPVVGDLGLARSRDALKALLPLIGEPARILIVNHSDLIPIEEAP